MRPTTLRRVDALLGVVLCFALTLHRRLVTALGRAGDPSAPPRKILFLKLIEQGATVLAYEAVQRAIERVGRDNVYFCVFTENRGIVDLLDLVPADNVLPIRSDSPAHALVDVLATIRATRAAGIDAVLDMELFSRGSAILAYLMGARIRVGLHRFREEAPYRGDLMTHRLAHNPFHHVADAYALLVSALDADPRDVPLGKMPLDPRRRMPPQVPPDAEERAHVQSLVDREAGRAVRGPVVLLNPNAGDLLPLRKWPGNRFVELARALLERNPEVTVLVTGAPSEREAALETCRQIGSPRVVCMAGRTTLREVVVLYWLADVMVTNDSGPGHFGALAPMHDIVLFGPGSPRQYGPLGEHVQIVWAELACSPCVNVYNHRASPCVDNRCMQAIGVPEVLERVERALAARAGGAG